MGTDPTLRERFESAWRFTRGLTADLLSALADPDLGFSPDQDLGPLWQQSRHLGRIQDNYVTALGTRRIRCGAPSVSCHDASRVALERYLQVQDRRLWRQLDDTAFDSIIDWGQEKVDVYEHLQRMVNHETLHHGQLIVYTQALDRAFPASWAAYGL